MLLLGRDKACLVSTVAQADINPMSGRAGYLPRLNACIRTPPQGKTLPFRPGAPINTGYARERVLIIHNNKSQDASLCHTCRLCYAAKQFLEHGAQNCAPHAKGVKIGNHNRLTFKDHPSASGQGAMQTIRYVSNSISITSFCLIASLECYRFLVNFPCV